MANPQACLVALPQELFELALADLDMRDLLRLRQTSHALQERIDETAWRRRTLFFPPLTYEQPPLGQRIKLDLKLVSEDGPVVPKPENMDWIELNPLLARAATRWQLYTHISASQIWSHGFGVTISIPRLLKQAGDKDPIEGSWKQIVVASPNVHSCNVDLLCYDIFSYVRLRAEDHDGILLGELIKEVHKFQVLVRRPDLRYK